MGNGFWLAFGQMCQLCFWTVRYLPRGRWQQLPRRTLMFGLVIPVFIFFQMLHWIGFACDEMFFRRYRKIKVKAPIFITGIPRSGTTHLQRVLAKHEQLTSMSTWECALAPSITERLFYSRLGRLIKPLFNWLPSKQLPFFKKMKNIHSLGLQEAEEDFIALLPINACFLMVVLFPHVEHYWQLTQFDKSCSEKKKEKILNYYHRILQKHLYFHGGQYRYLCKNPSFMTWVGSIKSHFSDASFVLCEREVEKTVVSQLSSLSPTWQLVYGEPMSSEFQSKIVKMLAGYYHYLEQLELDSVDGVRLSMSELVRNLDESIRYVLQHTSLDMTEQYATALAEEVKLSASYKSGHHYSDSKFDDWSELEQMFPVIWQTNHVTGTAS